MESKGAFCGREYRREVEVKRGFAGLVGTTDTGKGKYKNDGWSGRREYAGSRGSTRAREQSGG